MGAAPTDHICTPCPAGRGEWGWSEGAPGQYQTSPPPPWLHSYTIYCLILGQSLHLKYTCGKRANAQCPIRLPFKLFSILSSIILWVQLRLWERNCRGLKRVARQQEKGQAGGAWGLAQSSHVNVTRQTAPWFKGTVSLDFQISYIFLVFLYHSTPYDLLIHRQKLFCKLLLIWKDTVVPVYSTI